jgi:anthranilate synthase component I
MSRRRYLGHREERFSKTLDEGLGFWLALRGAVPIAVEFYLLICLPYNKKSRSRCAEQVPGKRRAEAARLIPTMLQPDFKQFSRLARESTLVPVVKSVSADLLTPVSAFLAIAETETHAFLLESAERGEQIGRYTFLGSRPYMRVKARQGTVEIERGRQCEVVQENVFQVVKRLLREHRPASVPGLPPFTAGAVGYFAYDVVRQLEKIGEHAKDDLALPDAELMFFDRLLAFDHLRHQIHIVATADVARESPRRAYDRALRDIATLEGKLASGLTPALWNKSDQEKAGKLKVHAGTRREAFLRSVERCKEYIAAGDIFQVVLSQRLDFTPEVAPFDLYRSLRQVNPSPYLYFLRMGDTHILGSSPEMLVRVTGRRLEYRPIAGTHPRGRDEAEDLRLEQQMRTDEKERAEHVMLVDLGRNDLGRVSDYGSVKVKDLMYVERYSHVMHLVSALEGTLRKDLDALDAFAACFPAGTLSGAPKVRAMQIIEELEPTRRGIYGGSVLYADFAGNLDSCIGIRTLLMQGKKAFLQAGAGIVADSDPASEFEESMNKAQAVLRAVERARAKE